MTTLFQRNYHLVLGIRDVTGLDVKFRVDKTLKSEPNTATIDIFNLAEETRLSLEKAKTIPVRLDVGYGNELMTIYLGQMRTATSVTDGPDIITHVESGDGEKQVGSNKASFAIGAGTPSDVVLTKLAESLGVGLGNVKSVAAKLKSAGKVMFPAGRVVTGNAARQLEDFCASAGLEFSIQDGNLQILDKNKALEGLAFELSSDSGLVGSPSVDTKGVVNAQTLFIPGLAPGRKLIFKSRHVNGGYRVEKCTYSGDTSPGAKEWYITIEGKKIT